MKNYSEAYRTLKILHSEHTKKNEDLIKYDFWLLMNSSKITLSSSEFQELIYFLRSKRLIHVRFSPLLDKELFFITLKAIETINIFEDMNEYKECVNEMKLINSMEMNSEALPDFNDHQYKKGKLNIKWYKLYSAFFESI